MAKPIPDLDLRNISKRDEIEKEEIHEEDNYPENYNSVNLIVGTVCGWVVGIGVAKVGKTAAFGLGGSVLLLHFAAELGYVQVNWVKVKRVLGRSQEMVNKTLSFVKRNSGGSVGFIGGFFFGVASA